MYGSRKERREPYIATRVVLSDSRQITIEEAFDGYELTDYSNQVVKISRDKVRYYLPRILSIDKKEIRL